MKTLARLSLCTALVLSGCGGTEPLSMVGDLSQGLDLPLNMSQSFGGTMAFLPYTSNTPYLTLSATGFTNATQVLAPGNGLVVEANLSTQTMIIYHNNLLTTKLYPVTPSVQTGAYVTRGSPVGVVLSQGGLYLGQPARVQYHVFFRGKPVCPVSYLDDTGRQNLTTAFTVFGFASNPCGR